MGVSDGGASHAVGSVLSENNKKTGERREGEKETDTEIYPSGKASPTRYRADQMELGKDD